MPFSAPCPECGQPMQNRYAKTCRACYEASRSAQRLRCTGCGKAFDHPSRIVTGLCSDCRNAQSQHGMHPCADCGQPATRERCWDCHLKQLALRHKLCAFGGCPRLAVARGLCMNHYQQAYQKARRNRQHVGGSLRAEVRRSPCQLCGFAQLRSHAHRLNEGANGGKYEWGNVVALCSRCHDMVHAGLVQPPLPLQPRVVVIQ